MSSQTEDTTEGHLQAQLGEWQAQVEHWKGVATVCELSKREELAELQKQYDQEIQSLQEALRETASQYESRIAALLEGRRASQGSVRKGKMEAEVTSPDRLPEDPQQAAQNNTEGYFSLRNCDSASLSSFSIDTPSLSRKVHAQEDTDSLVSTGTLVPEAIYLPPAGHRLVTHNDWDVLNAQVSELRGQVSRLEADKEELEKELETQTTHTHKQVSLLQSQVQSSEALLQDLQKSLSQSQSVVQSRLSELCVSQRKVCSDLSRLKGEKVEDEDSSVFLPSSLQATHCEERLRIQIVNLREHLDMRAEENEVLQAQLSTLKTEAERIQDQKENIQAELLACRTELEALRLALSHLQATSKVLSNEKADASSRGLRAVLPQQVEGVDCHVLYLSRKLRDWEARYSTVERECLAIRWAIGALHYYMLGRPFSLYSDHKPLQWLHRMRDTNARITRWYLAL
ncbi:rab GTPase-binding effector protein 2 isoform X1 [Nerophis ophidion]|uniref:rab GTPase-binding effector protein 2 isoform X1 n=1 Tax=Nerophis ophidion TaxID=159077 RepID=UPI002ADF6624|nr:rab GTPase-binding effector protein 2 isoform X1 [Nerophis ophidion]